MTVYGPKPGILTLGDFYTALTVTYAVPVPRVTWGWITNTLTDYIYLMPKATGTECALLQTRTFKTNALTIETSYYWPKPAGGLIPLSTPLLRFAQTRITGLTSIPIVLTNYYSQSYGAMNHNYFEDFLFEPRLEPGMPEQTLKELETADIQQVYVSISGGRVGRCLLVGFDQSLRPLQ